MSKLAGIGLEQGEILLIQTHRKNQALGRHVKEAGIKLSGINRGMFDKRRNFVKKALDFGVVAQGGPETGCVLLQLFEDVFPTGLERGYDHPLVQKNRLIA